MRSIFLGFILIIFAQSPAWGQVTQQEFKAFQDETNATLQQLRDTIATKNLALEMSKLYYEKAIEHLTLKEELNQGYINLKSWLLTFIGFVIGFFGVNLISILRYKEKTKQELFEQLSLWVGANQETVKFLIEEQEKKEALKENTRIMVISHNSDREQRPYKDLKSHGFKKVRPSIQLDDNFEMESIEDFQNVDVVILDNQHPIEDGNWNFSEVHLKEKLRQLMAKVNAADTHFIYYGENNNWDGRIKSLKEWREGKDKGTPTTITTLRKNLMELTYPVI